MDKAVRDVLVGKLFELSISESRVSFQRAFCDAHGLNALEQEWVSVCEMEFRQEIAESLVQDLIDEEFVARGLDREIHGLILDKDFSDVLDLSYDPPRLWAAVETQYRKSREGHSDRELRQEYIRMRMQG